MKLAMFFFAGLFMFAMAGGNSHEVYFGGNRYAHLTGQPEDCRRVYIHEQSGHVRVFYEDKNNIETIESSPNGEFVTAMVVERGTGERALRVLSRSSKLLVSIGGVYKFAWLQMPSSLVYVTGILREGGVGFAPKATWLIDVRNLRTEKLGFVAIAVAWSPFDSMVYFVKYETGDVLKYDVAKKRRYNTNHKGIHFSPSGRFYYRPNYDGLTFSLFTTDDKDITSQFRQLVGKLAVEPEPAWIDGSSMLVEAKNSETDTQWMVYDVNTMTTQKKIEGVPVGFSRDGSRIATYDKKHGGIQLVRLR